MQQLSHLLTENKTALVAVGARPGAGAGAGANAGVDVTSWRQSGFAPRVALVILEADADRTLAGPGGTAGALGAEVWGKSMGLWRIIGYLNHGADVPCVGGDHSYAEEVDELAAFDRLLIAGTPSAGVINYGFAPLETWR